MSLKNLAILILTLVVSVDAMAQNRQPQYHSVPSKSQSSSKAPKIDMVYAVAVGVSCPKLEFSGNDAQVSSSPGIKAGIMWGVDWGRFELVPEFWYSTFGVDFEEGASNIKGAELRNRSLDFPIMFGVKLFKPLKLHFGPTLSLMCNNELTTSKGEGYEFGRIKGSVGYAAGISYNLYRGLFLDLRYVGHFAATTAEYYGSNSSSDKYDIKMYSIDITAGFRF